MKLTRQELTDYCNAYGNDRDRLAKDLRTIFSDPGNILLFGFFCFPHHVLMESPAFHAELLELINQDTNVGIAAPRGHAKSTVVNLIYISWCILTQRHHYIISISDTYSQSVGFVNTLRQEFEDNSVIKWLYGDLRGKMWQDGKFETSTGVMVQARAYGMKIRGLKYRQYRPELLLFDDLENDESVQSIEQREKLKKWFTRAALPALAKNGRAVIVGTILHGDSLLMNIINCNGEFGGWLTKLYKALNEDDKGNEYSLWPQMYTVDELHDMRDNPNNPNYKGSLVFAQEYQNEPIDEMDAIIRKAWIDIVKWQPLKELIIRRGFACDPAISKKDTADFFAKVRGYSFWVIEPETNIKELHVMITKIGNDKLSFGEGIKEVNSWAKEKKTDFIGIEGIIFQSAYKSSLGGLPIVPLTPDKDKRRRTIAVSKFFEGNRVHFKAGIPNLQLAIDQLTHFPSVKHDDMVDAIVYLIDCLIFGATIPEKTTEQKERDEERRPVTGGLRSKQF